MLNLNYSGSYQKVNSKISLVNKKNFARTNAIFYMLTQYEN